MWWIQVIARTVTEQILFNCVFHLRNVAARMVGRRIVGNPHVFKPKS